MIQRRARFILSLWPLAIPLGIGMYFARWMDWVIF